MYCTVEALINRYGEQELIALTDKQGETGAVVTQVAQQAIFDADATIDAYLASRFTLPLANVPSVLERLSGDISRYFLYDEQVSEQIAKRYEAAIKVLEQVAKGNVSLGLSEIGIAPQNNDSATISSSGSVWGRQQSKGFI